MPTRPYAADDFDAIRARMNELRESTKDVDVVFFQHPRKTGSSTSIVVFRCCSERAKQKYIRLINTQTGIAQGTVSTRSFEQLMEIEGYTYRKVDNELEV